MNYVLLALFMMGLVGAVEVNVSCPAQVNALEEFTCDIAVDNGNGTYDIKFEIEVDDKSTGRIFNEQEGEWKSTYYWVKEFIQSGEEKQVRLNVTQQGDYTPLLKIRQGTKTLANTSFDLRVLEPLEIPVQEVPVENSSSITSDSPQEEAAKESKKKVSQEEVVEEEVIQKTTPAKVITLNSAEDEEIVGIKEKSLWSYLSTPLMILTLLLIGYYFWDRL